MISFKSVWNKGIRVIFYPYVWEARSAETTSVEFSSKKDVLYTDKQYTGIYLAL